ncbi:MAG: transglycosylase domain-containing protein, partial [Granulosicoccus sp.]|nr:transglycosylase domain-containing protein [Granulosicoccus sp.]
MPQTSSSHRSRRRGRGRHERRRKTSLLGSIFKWLAISGLSLGIIAAIGVGYLYYKIAPELPDVKLLREVELQMPLRVFTADGDLIAEYGEQRREPVQISEVPQVLQDAIVAAEDARFYKHPGVDYQGILRAVLHLIKTGEKGPGGSTITMQVARNFFLTRDVTYARKIKEIFLSFKIENELEKDEILELYVNKIYLGNRSYGFAAASKVYYGKKITEINLPEAAMLAGLPKAPSRYNPIVNPQRAKQRRSYVLRRLMEIGKIDERTYRATLDAPVTATLHYSRPEAEADYVGEMARARVQQLFGDRWSTAGFNVFTTIRSNDQQIANRSLRDALFDYERRHGFKGAIDQLDANILQNPEQLAEALRKYSNHGEMIASAVTAVSDESAVVITEDLIEYTFALEEDIDWARERLDIDQLGKELTSVTEVFEVGDVIYLQATDENSARIVQEPSVEAAFVAMEPNSGAIKALVGGFDFHRSKFNRVTQARRQPGSTFKPFIYSAALEYGDTPATIYNDAPVVFHDPALEGEWRPRNYSGRFYGPTRLREALVYSMNLVSVRVLREITVPYAIDYAERFGFDESNMPPDLSLALGSAAVTPMEMTSAFSVFANGGYRVQPHFIDRIEDPRGNVVYDTPKVVLCDDCDPAAASPLLAEMEAETAAQSPKTAVDDESTANAE